ncbi:cobalamin-binding protein [Lacimicrobium alkaliphilum]|uniref:Cobalamin-binding protein n=1 Tax=Lacimicrobium alkaliphilum TaxID=1526571 RepID=A0ABQ1QYW9_9ALTE|nr:cobalamin-binding protein [Lacimicrobium alkaliphilum]GGD50565.1 cobalamin-binding protein [Lacimicrobium alkaliphilum]
MKRLVICLLSLLMHPLCAATPQRIVSLAPHTTELVYSLEAGERLLAVSDYSDYPEAAQALPRIASYQGVNFEALVRLEPDLVLVWEGGNKPQDIRKIRTLGYNVFVSSPGRPEDIADEVETLGDLLGKGALAKDLAQTYRQSLKQIAARYAHTPPIRVFYYMHPKPLMSIGSGAWANKLLSLCNSNNVFSDAINDYPEVTMEEVIRRQPQAIVAAQHQDEGSIQQFWQPWHSLLKMDGEHIVRINPDKLHRFSLRLSNGVKTLCQKLHGLR